MIPGNGEPILLTHPKPLTVEAGQPTERALAFGLRTGRVTITTPDGKPAADIELLALPSGDPRQAVLARTDAQGVGFLRGSPGTYRRRAPQRRLTDQQAYLAHWQSLLNAHGGDQDRARKALLDGLVDLGTIALGANSKPLSIRLPEAVGEVGVSPGWATARGLQEFESRVCA